MLNQSIIDEIKNQDYDTIVGTVEGFLEEQIDKTQSNGVILGLSGGIDSTVSMVLAVKALGPDKIFGVMMPEKDSSPDSEELATELAYKFGVQTTVEVITGALDGYNCYERRDQAVKEIVPTYDPSTHKMKIGIKHAQSKSKLPPLFHLTVVNPDGSEIVKRLPSKQMRTIIAASNFKQRSRTSMLYFHADAKNYAVIGTGNKNEHEQGFFVKYGDGGADTKPIAHLFKTQVYQLAEYLGVPADIRRRTPTTDTYSAEQTQEEFFFRIPYKTLDKIWLGWEKGYSNEDIANELELAPEQIENVIQDIIHKKNATEYLRMEPI